MRAFVIVGASGVRGRAVLDAASAPVRCLARDPRFAHEHAHVLTGDVDRLPAELFPQDEHVVLHFAVDHVDPTRNVAVTERLLAQLPSRTRGVIYASSASVYGRGPLRRASEAAPVAPATLLARSRAASERLVLDWALAKGKSAIVLRTRFLVAPDESEVASALRALAHRRFIPGSGRQRFTALSGAAFGRAVLALVERILDEPVREALNLGWTGTPELGAVLSALVPATRIPLRLDLLPWRLLPRRARALVERVELVSLEQTLDVTRAVSGHGLAFLERSPEDAAAEVARIVALERRIA